MPFSSGGRTTGVLPDRRLRAHVATEEGPSAPSSGAVVLKVRVWSDAEREGGGALRHASERGA